MYGGGMVQPNYAGGGMIEDEYMKGGKVKKGLKPVPQGNPGLGKLPEMVRNKMGYMEDGGEVMDYLNTAGLYNRFLLESGKDAIPQRDLLLYQALQSPSTNRESYLDLYDSFNKNNTNRNFMKDASMTSALLDKSVMEGISESDSLKLVKSLSPEGKRLYDDLYLESGMQEGGEVQDSLVEMMYGGMANKKKKGYQEGGTVIPFQMVDGSLGQSSRVDPNTNMPLYDARQVISVPAEEVGGGSGLRYYGGMETGNKIENAMQEALKLALATAESSPQDSIPADMVKKFLKPRKKGLMGLLGFQEGGMIGPPLPPEMMGQAMNQKLGDSIDMRMANPQMGGALGVMRQESEAIEAAMKDNIARNARLALQKMKLDSVMQMEPQGMSIPDSLITNPQSLDNGFLRLLQEMNQSKGVRIPRPSTLR